MAAPRARLSEALRLASEQQTPERPEVAPGMSPDGLASGHGRAAVLALSGPGASDCG